MQEFYLSYTKQLLKNIMEAFKKGDMKAVKEYSLELKELNKTIYLDKELVR